MLDNLKQIFANIGKKPITHPTNNSEKPASSAQPRSQIQLWKEIAVEKGTLYQVGMNQESRVSNAGLDEATFYTNGFHGCVFYLELRDGEFRFGHIDANIALRNHEMLRQLPQNGSIVVAPDIPELDFLQGNHVHKYKLPTNPVIDNFAERMALQESPELLSVAVKLIRTGEVYSGYLNAFQSTPDSKWHISYYPQQIATKLTFQSA